MPQARKQLDILFVGYLPPIWAGSAISTWQLLVGFAKLGHRVRAIAPITAEALAAGDTLARAPRGLQVLRFEVPYFPLAGKTPPPDEYRALERERIERVMRAAIADQRPDIVLIGRELYVWHVLDIARKEAVPCILLARGHPTQAILDGAYPELAAQRLLQQYRKVNLVVVPSHHLAHALQRLGLHNVRAIVNAIDLRQFVPGPRDDALLRRLNIRNGDVAVVHVSNLTEVKRPLDIVCSADRALQQDPRLQYVIVGDGPLRESMEQTCRQKGLSERFRFVGWVEYERVPNYINLADIVVMPSEAEGLARVYLEAQACGRALLASDIPAAREVVVDGQTGLLFRRGDIEQLAAKTVLAAADQQLRTEIGRNARERVKAHSLDDAVAGYVGTLESVVRRHLSVPPGAP